MKRHVATALFAGALSAAGINLAVAQEMYVGEVRQFGFNWCPYGWLQAAGQVLPISQYTPLFALIGTTFGGNGSTTFALPNLSSRIPIHQGLGYVPGESVGVEEVVLTQAHLPTHTHQLNASSQAAVSTSPAGASWAATTTPQFSTDTAAPLVAMSPNGLSSVGGNQPHDNMPPYLAVNFIISLYGVYPSPT